MARSRQSHTQKSDTESRVVVSESREAQPASAPCVGYGRRGTSSVDDARPALEPPPECGPVSSPASVSPVGRGRDTPPEMDSPTPLEVLLGVMNHHWRARRYDKAAALARDAAPYLHPRLTRVAHQGSVVLRHEDALEELD